jgi:inositol hexakisphosphate/diphosphoinositol-pentakisphosphate kinase
VKVYTVGPDYGHAEARKSPVVDGKVNRDPNGMEVRYPVILTHLEKEIARTIVMAFGQYVCGFDILRVAGTSYVCDVNGWSFVKTSRKYYDDASQILVEYMLKNLRPRSKDRPPRPPPRSSQAAKDKERTSKSQSALTLESMGEGYLDNGLRSPSPNSASASNKDQLSSSVHSVGTDVSAAETFAADTNAGTNEELRSVIAVIRHGDRTPKQKMKIKITEQKYLDYFHEFAASAEKDLKVKSKPALLRFLDLTRQILAEKGGDEGLSGEGGIDEDKVDPLVRKLRQIKDVLERREISGINRKLQMKPLKWSGKSEKEQEERDGGMKGEEEKQDPNKEEKEGRKDAASTPLRATQLLVILKWGGDLTTVGVDQAVKVGALFRNTMYPSPSGGGILRLHATYRHDLKIKASDEGRVMKTAAAFTKGLLELEGQLTPILASLVTVEERSRQMLDKGGNYMVKDEMDRCKAIMEEKLQVDAELDAASKDALVPASQVSVRQGLERLGNPHATLMRMHELINDVCSQLDELAKKEVAGEKVPDLYLTETFDLMAVRWQKLNKDFLDPKTSRYDLTKVPDVYDMIRFDVLHNASVGLTSVNELYELSMAFADTVVPQEYGMGEVEKRIIGSMMCSALLEKIAHDLQAGVASGDERGFMLDHSHAEDLAINTPDRLVRTRLYFTSESHLHTLLNVLRFTKDPSNCVITDEGKLIVATCPELSYLTQIVFRLYENKTTGEFRVAIDFSPGATDDPRGDSASKIEAYQTLQDGCSVDSLITCLKKAIAAVEDEGPEYFRSSSVASGADASVEDSTGTRLRSISDPLKLKRATSITVIAGSEADGSLWDLCNESSGNPSPVAPVGKE